MLPKKKMMLIQKLMLMLELDEGDEDSVEDVIEIKRDEDS